MVPYGAWKRTVAFQINRFPQRLYVDHKIRYGYRKKVPQHIDMPLSSWIPPVGEEQAKGRYRLHLAPLCMLVYQCVTPEILNPTPSSPLSSNSQRAGEADSHPSIHTAARDFKVKDFYDR